MREASAERTAVKPWALAAAILLAVALADFIWRSRTTVTS
jgi:hypothetical protein